MVQTNVNTPWQVPRNDLYIPTNPDCRLLAVIPESGTPMQSAAKVRLASRLAPFALGNRSRPRLVIATLA